MYAATTVWRAWKNGYPRLPRAGWAERFAAFRKSIWGLLLIVIIMGGIYGGIFTPTEAAAVSAVYAFVIAVFVYKDIRMRDVPKVLLTSAAMSAMLLYIITNAVMFAFILTSEQIPQHMSDWIVSLGFGKIGFLLMVNIMLLVIGMVMEPSAIILIMAPILYPIAVKLGIDPVHFGIILIVNMEIGLATPPVGLNLYVGSAISKLGLTEVSKSVVPWLLTALVFLMMITYIPEITLFLPRLMGCSDDLRRISSVICNLAACFGWVAGFVYFPPALCPHMRPAPICDGRRNGCQLLFFAADLLAPEAMIEGPSHDEGQILAGTIVIADDQPDILTQFRVGRPR